MQKFLKMLENSLVDQEKSPEHIADTRVAKESKQSLSRKIIWVDTDANGWNKH